jgi:hypothetical protein
MVLDEQRSHRFRLERFSLKKLNEVESKEEYCVEVSRRFAALENLDAEVDIDSVENKPNCSGYNNQAKEMGII